MMREVSYFASIISNTHFLHIYKRLLAPKPWKKRENEPVLRPAARAGLSKGAGELAAAADATILGRKRLD